MWSTRMISGIDASLPEMIVRQARSRAYDAAAVFFSAGQAPGVI